MNNQHKMLLNLAQQLTAEYTQDPRVKATMLVGSIAQGRGDIVSDIDIMMYYDPLPDEDEIEALKTQAKDSGGDIYGYDDESGLAMYKFIDGVKVDIGHHPLAWMENLIDEFLADPQIDDTTSQIIMSGIAGGRPLHGEELLRGWQEKLANVPDSYYRELVEKNMYFTPLAVIKEMSVDREDYAAVYELFLFNAKRILNLLCGLNKVIPPGKLKSMEHVLAQLEITPPDLIGRLRQLWLADPAEATHTLHQLELDLLDLIDHHHPDLNTGRSRERLHLKLRL